jgi:hypothetical protein
MSVSKNAVSQKSSLRQSRQRAVVSHTPMLSLVIRVLRRNPRNRLRASRGTCHVTFLGGDQRNLKVMRQAALMLHTTDYKPLIPMNSPSNPSGAHFSRKAMKTVVGLSVPPEPNCLPHHPCRHPYGGLLADEFSIAIHAGPRESGVYIWGCLSTTLSVSYYFTTAYERLATPFTVPLAPDRRPR